MTATKTLPQNDVLVASANRFAVPLAKMLRRLAELDKELAAARRSLALSQRALDRNPASQAAAKLAGKFEVRIANLEADRAAAESVASQLTRLINTR